MAPIQPSREELDRRKASHVVGINAETVTNVSSTDFPGHWPGEDNSWSLEEFRNTLKVDMHHSTRTESSFSLIGIDASVANAFRRIMIAEIPSVAIEDVFIHNNTSIIQDEVLCQRLGLVPFQGGKQGIREFLKWHKKANPEVGQPEGESDKFDYNTIILSLKIECTRNKEAEKGESDPLKAYHNAHVYAKDIQFKPFGRQEQYFSGDDAIRPTNPDILIAKLRPGQCIDIDMHAFKGVGSDHAKFSPVATASYRLLPTITITKPILGKDAEKFQRCFPHGVIKLDKVSKKEAMKKGSGYEGHEGQNKAVVLDAMKDTVSRECLRHPEFEGKVKLGRIRDHFIFSVESVGQWESEDLFLESVKVLKTKCEALKKNLSTIDR
ncbi:DNA-directed RNA polymerases I and III subunit RPAC1 [Lachnellula suecica]|uniref:DNA-directed RNA polymerases I and III subunit RPAC1 n=1 Tax=Lachnellula suecica TaxID=602035 RepID=A0A8T9C5I8_9HELO|nr:DNA-directed RNA polymerases I and III subunit RPAC1 [Lachnellula suecica]